MDFDLSKRSSKLKQEQEKRREDARKRAER
jgi:hypothetical protein